MALQPEVTDPPDAAEALRAARLRADVAEAERVVVAALGREQAHSLDPDDLVWLVGRVGTWKSSWRAGQAIAAWLFHHGPVHQALVQTAEEIADGDNAIWLDQALLWIEPTPYRWYMLACWHVTCSCGTSAEGDAGCASYPRWVLEQRGDAARRSLAAAPHVAEPDSDARRVLEAWAAALT